MARVYAKLNKIVYMCVPVCKVHQIHLYFRIFQGICVRSKVCVCAFVYTRKTFSTACGFYIEVAVIYRGLASPVLFIW